MVGAQHALGLSQVLFEQGHGVDATTGLVVQLAEPVSAGQGGRVSQAKVALVFGQGLLALRCAISQQGIRAIKAAL
jgi:hypothetical protein